MFVLLEIEAIGKGTPAYYHWTVEERKIKSFDSYLEDWEDWEKIIEKNRLRYLKEKKVQKNCPTNYKLGDMKMKNKTVEEIIKVSHKK